MAGWSTACRFTRWCSWSSTMANVGLPGTSGFVGEFMTLIGHLQGLDPHRHLCHHRRHPVGGLCLVALPESRVRRAVKPSLASIKDLTFRESLTLFPLVALTILFGFYPEAGARYVGGVRAATR